QSSAGRMSFDDYTTFSQYTPQVMTCRTEPLGGRLTYPATGPSASGRSITILACKTAANNQMQLAHAAGRGVTAFSSAASMPCAAESPRLTSRTRYTHVVSRKSSGASVALASSIRIEIG